MDQPNALPMDMDPPTVTIAQNEFDTLVHQLHELEARINNSAPSAPPSSTHVSNSIPSESSATEPAPQVPSMVKPVRPSVYTGVKDYATLENWISSVDSYFCLTNARPPQIYYYLNTIFTGDAAIWYRYHFKSSQASTLEWSTVRAAMRGFFTPPNRDRRLRDQWASLHQTTSVVDYVARFLKLAMQIPNLTEEDILDKFIRGLKQKTRMELELKEPKTIAEAMRLADRYDSIMFTKTVHLGQKTSKDSAIEYEPGGEPMQLDALRVSTKGKSNSNSPAPKATKDSNATNAPVLKKLTPEERDQLRNIGACFKCRKTGHMAKECPTNSKNSKNQQK